MNNEIRRRIKELESKITGAPVVLHFADGSTRTIRGSVLHWRALFDADWAAVETDLSEELGWIRDCVRIEEPAQMYGLLKAMLAGPVERGKVNDDQEVSEHEE